MGEASKRTNTVIAFHLQSNSADGQQRIDAFVNAAYTYYQASGSDAGACVANSLQHVPGQQSAACCPAFAVYQWSRNSQQETVVEPVLKGTQRGTSDMLHNPNANVARTSRGCTWPSATQASIFAGHQGDLLDIREEQGSELASQLLVLTLTLVQWVPVLQTQMSESSVAVRYLYTPCSSAAAAAAPQDGAKADTLVYRRCLA